MKLVLKLEVDVTQTGPEKILPADVAQKVVEQVKMEGSDLGWYIENATVRRIDIDQN